jgi:hypothetical protein
MVKSNQMARRILPAWALVAMLAGSAPAAAPTTQPLQTVTHASPVAATDLDQTLAQQWVVLSLAANQQAILWGVPVTADRPTTAIAGCSSEYQFCLVLDGAVTRKDLSADTGHVIFWSPQPGTATRVMEFSGRDLQQSLRHAGRPDLAKRLDGFSDRQATRRWWGLVRPMKVNIGAPLRPAIDNARKSYLMQPEVVRVRRATTRPVELPWNVASAMMDRLKASDTSAVAELLSPALFVEPAKRNELAKARHGVAADLVAQPWTQAINPDSLRATDDPMRYWFSSGDQNFIMTLSPFDQMVFVQSIEPKEQP